MTKSPFPPAHSPKGASRAANGSRQNNSLSPQHQKANLAQAKKSSPNQDKNNKHDQASAPSKWSRFWRKKVVQIVAYILLAIIAMGMGSFGYVSANVLGKIKKTDVDIVESHKMPVIASDKYDSIDIDAVLASKKREMEQEIDVPFASGDTSSNWSKGGHTPVYVDEDNPIRKVKQKDPDVQNILVFGIDSRGPWDYACRSDALMIVSLDHKTNAIKLISIMRDTGVKMNGRSDFDKITHAYAYGGVGLLINTLNENFDLDIQKFVMLDFKSASDVIDLCGGVYIDVLPREVKYANINITEQNVLSKSSVSLLSSSGTQKLNGVQASGWSRVRGSDSDYQRAGRQRTLAMALIKQIGQQSSTTQLSLIEDAAGIFETNLSQTEMIKISSGSIGLINNLIERQVPEDGLFYHYTHPRVGFMQMVDYEQQVPLLAEFLWGEFKE